MQDLFIKW